MAKTDTEPTSEPTAPFDPKLENRKRLLAQVAGAIAGSLLVAPSKSVKDAEAVAEIAVDVAEQILKKVGL